MDDVDPVSRRTFIAGAAVSVAAGLAACARLQPETALAAGERRLVAALANQVVPPDDAPGGNDADVPEFIDRQLRGPYRRFLPAYRDGLRKLDDTSRRLHQRAFADLEANRQTALLEAVEAGKVPGDIWSPNEAGQFFRMVCDHCLQGYYGSPRHGGNRGYASWRMIGLDHPQVVGRVMAP